MAVADERVLTLDRRLDAWTHARPWLARPLELEGQLVRESLTSARAPVAQPFAVPREHVAARVREGMPLLNDQPAHLDIQFASDLFGRLLAVLERREDVELLPRLAGIAGALVDGELDRQRLFSEAFVQHGDHLAGIGLELGIDVELLATLAARAVTPLLHAYAQRLLPLVAQLDVASSRGAAWQRGYCPICGGWPAMAELQLGGSQQLLRCAACGSGWHAQRLACPYCGNTDHRSLHTVAIDGEQAFGLLACDRCQGYLKVGDGCDPAPPALLPVDDLATRGLDVAAAERGYRRPEGSGFRIELAVPEDDWPDELAED